MFGIYITHLFFLLQVSQALLLQHLMQLQMDQVRKLHSAKSSSTGRPVPPSGAPPSSSAAEPKGGQPEANGSLPAHQGVAEAMLSIKRVDEATNGGIQSTATTTSRPSSGSTGVTEALPGRAEPAEDSRGANAKPSPRSTAHNLSHTNGNSVPAQQQQNGSLRPANGVANGARQERQSAAAQSRSVGNSPQVPLHLLQEWQAGFPSGHELQRPMSSMDVRRREPPQGAWLPQDSWGMAQGRQVRSVCLFSCLGNGSPL